MSFWIRNRASIFTIGVPMLTIFVIFVAVLVTVLVPLIVRLSGRLGISSTLEWGIPLFIGLFFTGFGGLKTYGFYMGYEGGPGRSQWERLRAGSRAEEHCNVPPLMRKPFFLCLNLFFLATGLYCLLEFYFAVSA